MATVKPEALREFSEQPAEVQALICNSLALTEQNLTYKYGSADPAAGGMDCSGFIYYVLSNAGFKDVPRDSAGQYAWVRKNGNFRAVLSRSADTFELNGLQTGGSAVLVRHLQGRSRYSDQPRNDLSGQRKIEWQTYHGGSDRRAQLRRDSSLWG